MFVVDASDHEVVFICAGKFRVGSKDFVDGDQGQSLILVTMKMLESAIGYERTGDALVALASGNVTDEMALFVVQVLQVEVQRVDLGLCFLGLLFGVARVENGAAIKTAQLGQVGVKKFLLATELHLSIGIRLSGAIVVDEVEHVQALSASLGGSVQNRLKEGVSNECASVHG